jgi:hypothetical protein
MFNKNEITQYFLQNAGFNTRGIKPIRQHGDKQLICEMPIGVLLEMQIENWKYNRPPDMIRCAQIAETYLSTPLASQLDCIFKLHLNTAAQKFEVIDGIHRITALKMLHEQFVKDAATMSPKQKYYAFYNTMIFVSIYKDQSEIALANQFYLINRAVSISTLHLEPIEQTVAQAQLQENIHMFDEDEDEEDHHPHPHPPIELANMPNIALVVDRNQHKRGVIERIVSQHQVKYKLQFSANDKCHRPNINRDRYIDIVDGVWKVLELYCELNDMEREIIDTLDAVNEYAKSLVENSGEHISAKLKKSGGYIFTMDKNNIVYWAQTLSNKYV